MRWQMISCYFLSALCWKPLKLTCYVLIFIILWKAAHMEEIKLMLVAGALKGQHLARSTACVFSIQILIFFFLYKASLMLNMALSWQQDEIK